MMVGLMKRVWAYFHPVEVRQEQLKANLIGLGGAVCIRQPNGSRCGLQNVVEQELTKMGMALYSLPLRCADLMHKDGVWGEELRDEIELAVVGTVVVKELLRKDRTYDIETHGYVYYDRVRGYDVTVDVRFYGRDGSIHGGFAKQREYIDLDYAWSNCSVTIVESLAEGGWNSVGAHV